MNSFHKFVPVNSREANKQNGVCKCGTPRLGIVHLNAIERRALGMRDKALEQHLENVRANRLLEGMAGFNGRTMARTAFIEYAKPEARRLSLTEGELSVLLSVAYSQGYEQRGTHGGGK